MIGQMIDHYKVAKVIARTAIAETYLAVHTETGAKAVLEGINNKLFKISGFKEKLNNDMARLIALDHPNLIVPENVVEQDGVTYLVHSYRDGSPLSALIQRADSFPMPDAAAIVHGAMAGIQYAASQGYVHQFLQPRKLIVAPDGQVSILDFGGILQIAKEKYRKKDKLVVPAHYFAPERFGKPGLTDIRTSVYALGVILFEMACGRRPYTGKTYDELAALALEGIPDPRRLEPSVPDAMARLIMQACEIRPENRFQNIDEMRAALEQAAAAPPPPEQTLGDFDDDFGVGETLESSYEFGYDKSPATPVAEAPRLGDQPGFGFRPAAEGDSAEIIGHDEFQADMGGGQSAGDGVRLSEAPGDAEIQHEEPAAAPDLGGSGAENNPDLISAHEFESSIPPGDSFGQEPGPFDKGSGQADGGFDFGTGDDGGGFDFGSDSAGSDGGGFDFGADSAGSDGGDFDFGGDAAGSDAGGGFDFGSDSPDGGGFDFGTDAPQSGSDDGFDFGTDTAGSDGGFDFGTDAGGNDDGGFDFGADAGGNDDGGFDFGADVGGNDDGGFDFGSGAQDSDDGGGFDFGTDTAGSGGGFDFGAETPEAGSDGGFDFGSGSADDGGGFDFGSDQNDPFGNSPGLDEGQAGGGFDFGDSEGSEPADPSSGGFDFGAGLDATTSDSGGQDAFDFGSSDDPFDNSSGPFDNSSGQAGGGFDFGEQSSDDAGGFDFGDNAASESAEPFDFGTPEPVADKDAGGFDFSAGEGQTPADADPFGGDADPFGGSGDDPFAASGEETFSGTTDDGAFSFEPSVPGDESAGDGGPPPPPLDAPLEGMQASPAKAGLESSIAELERSEPVILPDRGSGPEKKKVKPQRRVVRKFDKKILALTGVLAVLVLAGVYVIITKRQQAAADERVASEIQTLVDQARFDDAIDRLDAYLPEASSSYKRRFRQMRANIEEDKKNLHQQIETLMAGARELEEQGRIVEDGKNDAFSLYMKVISLYSEHPGAREAVSRIKQDQLAEVDTLLAEEEEMAALRKLGVLAAGARSDREIQKRYTDLKDRLEEERSANLKASIDSDYSAQRFEAMVPKLEELREINPDSSYVRDMSKALVSAFDEKAQGLVSRREYGEAERLLTLALDLDKENPSIKESLDNIEESKLEAAIRVKVRQLGRAVKKGDYPAQYELARELSNLDPGNQTANTALDGISEEIRRLETEAEEERQRGRFKQAADLFKQIYDINGGEAARSNWMKFAAWAPPEGMAYVPKGEYKRGHRDAFDAIPVKKVYIDSFFIDQHEVTNAEFKAFVDANPSWSQSRIDPRFHDGNYLDHWVNGSPHPDDLQLPIANVSWYAARAYAEWKGKRLPTEAEWEKAARGNADTAYWWGDYSDAKMAVYEFYPEKRPAPVGSFPANPFDIYEILGNVYEWVEDTYDPRFYRESIEEANPVNTSEGKHKVFRGGSFRNRGRELKVFLRPNADPKFCSPMVGFRCAMDARDSL